VLPNGAQPTTFIINDWDFTNPKAALPADPNLPGLERYIRFFLKDKDGIAGQNERDPASEFDNHQIVVYQGKIYDPSYGGGPYAGADLNAALRAWEITSLAGVTYKGPITFEGQYIPDANLTVKQTAGRQDTKFKE
jgi:hypothetical protein